MKTFISICSLFITSSIILASCGKEGKQCQLTVKMKDAPGDFMKVNVEVLSVEIHTQHDGWIPLSTNQGIYDLLTLQYDMTAVLVDHGTLPAGKADQMRLLLGTNNTVMVDSVYYSLSAPGAQQTGLKINLNTSFDPDEQYELLIDFDAKQSIVQQGNGSYYLKPVVKLAGIVEL